MSPKYFKLPLTEAGSNYLETFGIKEHVISWKQLYDQIEEEDQGEDEDEESFKKVKVMKENFELLLNKELFISLLHALIRSDFFRESKKRISKLLIFNIF